MIPGRHMRALVVEDDEAILRLLTQSLEQEGFDVDRAQTVSEGGRLARGNEYELIILDMQLPDGRGIAVLEVIRERGGTTPVLIVSGEGDIDAMVRGLDAGADDYLDKPYQPQELRARIRALLRRGPLAGSPTIGCGNMVLHRTERRAMVDDAQLKLTAKEFALLEYLIVNRGKTLTRKELLSDVWRFDFDPGTNVVDVNVSRLRAKLAVLGATCRVEAERGVGYVFDER